MHPYEWCFSGTMLAASSSAVPGPNGVQFATLPSIGATTQARPRLVSPETQRKSPVKDVRAWAPSSGEHGNFLLVVFLMMCTPMSGVFNDVHPYELCF